MPLTSLFDSVRCRPVAECEEAVTNYSRLLEVGLVDPLPPVVVLYAC